MTRDIDAWLAEGKPEEIEVGVCFRRDLLTEFERCTHEYEAAVKVRSRLTASEMLDPDDTAEATAQRLADLLEQIEADEAAHTFKFRKMPYEAFREIIENNPLTAEQRAANPFRDHDPHAAAPALVAGSCVFPELTLEDAEKLREFLPESPWEDLYSAAMRANRTGGNVPKDVRSSVRNLASGLRSTTSVPTASLSPSSEDEL